MAEYCSVYCGFPGRLVEQLGSVDVSSGSPMRLEDLKSIAAERLVKLQVFAFYIGAQ